MTALAIRQRLCSVEGCDRPINARGLCAGHYTRWYLHGDTRADIPLKVRRADCSIEGCEEKHLGLGYCRRHYVAFKRYGDPLADHRRRHVVEHGTYNEYQNYGCRCARCKKAASDYQRARSVVPCRGGCGRNVWLLNGHGRNRSGFCPSCSGRLRRTAEHGTESRYNGGCRCAACRAAANAARNSRRRKVPCATCGTLCLAPGEKGRRGSSRARCRSCFYEERRRTCQKEAA
jgi:hypothetical protein